jgi:hypothetical protein
MIYQEIILIMLTDYDILQEKEINKTFYKIMNF